jgi:hypothetical protein
VRRGKSEAAVTASPGGKDQETYRFRRRTLQIQKRCGGGDKPCTPESLGSMCRVRSQSRAAAEDQESRNDEKQQVKCSVAKE